MKPYAIFIPFLLSLLHADAQNLISGKVTDQETGEPLPAAKVYLHNSKNGAVTDLDSNFEIYSNLNSCASL